MGEWDLESEISASSVPCYLSEPYMLGVDIPIDEEFYLSLRSATIELKAIFELDELFHIFAQTFIRFEKDLLDMAIEFAYPVFVSFGDEQLLGNFRKRFNVNIITILTSYKTYDDQVSRILKNT